MKRRVQCSESSCVGKQFLGCRARECIQNVLQELEGQDVLVKYVGSLDQIEVLED